MPWPSLSHSFWSSPKFIYRFCLTILIRLRFSRLVVHLFHSTSIAINTHTHTHKVFTKYGANIHVNMTIRYQTTPYVCVCVSSCQSFNLYYMHEDLKIKENINKMHQKTRKVTLDDSTHPTFETNTNKYRNAGQSRKRRAWESSCQQTNDANIMSQKTIWEQLCSYRPPFKVNMC